MFSLLCSVQALLGGDNFPINTIQTLYSSTGVMLGAIINANIFGELAVIMSSMGQVEKNF